MREEANWLWSRDDRFRLYETDALWRRYFEGIAPQVSFERFCQFVPGIVDEHGNFVKMARATHRQRLRAWRGGGRFDTAWSAPVPTTLALEPSEDSRLERRMMMRMFTVPTRDFAHGFMLAGI